jgi:uncharacterized membrane protein YphA (DoxX/SURF4 family)
MKLSVHKELALPILRIGISLVFLWFGLNQVLFPDEFLGYLPEFLLSIDFAANIIIINGIIETILGLLLIFGFFVQPIAFLLGLHMIGIILSVGYNEIAVRDFGILVALVAIFIGGNDKWCIVKKK